MRAPCIAAVVSRIDENRIAISGKLRLRFGDFIIGKLLRVLRIR